MIVGYARVSTTKQDLQVQISALKEAGATKIYQEKVSGVSSEKKQLSKMKDEVKAGDTLIVTKADRLARSLSQLESVVKELTDRGVTVHILNMGLFTAQNMENPLNKLMFNVLGSFAEFERSMIMERTQEGLNEARARGVKFGRKSKQYEIKGALLDAIEKAERGEISQAEGAEYVGCSLSTFKRRVKEYKQIKGDGTSE